MKVRPATLAGAALVLGAAALSAFWGLEVRDLSNTELEEFAGSGPLGILTRSITPTENDWGAHMPLSHIIRVVLVDLLGETRPLSWRLHVALASCAAALVTWRLGSQRLGPRWGVAAGLLVGLHPVVSFHAHESTNYGFGALMGALLVAAVLRWEEDAPGGALLLGAAAAVGMFNDLFFIFPFLAAFAWTGWRALADSTARSRFLRAWGGVAALFSLPALWFLSNASKLPGERIVGPHADPIPPESEAMLVAGWDLMRRFAGGYVGGYLDAGEGDLWVTGGPVVLVLLIGVFALRRPGPVDIARTAAWLGLVAFGGILIARLLFGAMTGREFTTEPRIYTALTPALALGWTSLCARLGGRVGGPLLAVLIVLVAIPTVRQLATLSHRDTRAAEVLQRHVQEGDVLVVTRQVAWRLGDALRERAHQGCLRIDELGGLPDRIWLAAEEDGEQLQAVRDCEGHEVARPGDGWRVRVHERFSPPDYDRKSASFLPELVVTALERGDPSIAPRDLGLRVVRTPGGASAPLEARVSIFAGSDGRPDEDVEPLMEERAFVGDEGNESARFDGLGPGSWVRVSINRRDAPDNSLGGLLLPLGQPVLDLYALPVLANPLLGPRTIELPPVSGPGLRVAERLLRTLLALALLVALSLAAVRARGP